MSFRMHHHGDVPHSRRLHEECERQADTLQSTFPEVKKTEVSIVRTSDGYEAQVHVSGKDVNAAAHATRPSMRGAATTAFSKVTRQLRKHHDKLIFARRREAQRAATHESGL